MSFLLRGIDPSLFASWFELTDSELAARGARRVVADASPGYPCRVSLADAEVGEELLLVPYAHHATDSPYRGAGPVFVRRGARQQVVLDHVPEVLSRRMLSLRAYDDAGMMVAAELVDGRELAPHLEHLLARAAYVHVHYAKPGCFAVSASAGRAATPPRGHVLYP